jgi:pre-rRNA-processing protein TSR1
VGVLALGAEADATSAAASLVSAADDHIVSPVAGAVGNPVTCRFAAHKQRMTVIVLPRPSASAGDPGLIAESESRSDPTRPVGTTEGNTDIVAFLEAVRCCDLVLAVIDMSDGYEAAIDATGDVAISGMRSAGFPSVAGCIQGIPAVSPKKQTEARRLGEKLLQQELGEDCKVAQQESLDALVRAVVTAKPRSLTWRERRSTMVVHSMDFVLDSSLTASAHASGVTSGYDALRSMGQPLDPLAVDVLARASATQGEGFLEQFGTLVLSGWIRGPPLGCDTLVHVPRMGTFAPSQVTEDVDPLPMKTNTHETGSEATPTLSDVGHIRLDGPTIALRGSDVDTTTLAVPSTDGNDQTWPTAEEERMAVELERQRSLAADRTRHGVDEYAASWLVGEDVAFAEEDDAGENGGLEVDEEDGDEDGGPAVPEAVDKNDPETRRRLFAEDEEFPDEVDTPQHITARARFARYRGMESMRTAEWHQNAGLPPSYSRLYSFRDFGLVKRAVEGQVSEHARAMLAAEMELMKVERTERSSSDARPPSLEPSASAAAAAAAAEDEAVSVGGGSVLTSAATAMDMASLLHDRTGASLAPSGRFAVLHIPRIPRSLMSHRPGNLPLLITSLLKHEGRTTVIHSQMQRSVLAPDESADGDDYREGGVEAARESLPVKSKDPLEFHIGPRCIDARPVFSLRSNAGNRHRFKRWMPNGGYVMTSILAPVSFPPQSVLMYRRYPSAVSGALGPAELVGTGFVIGADPSQMVLKRTLLTGVPVKTKKRWAVVKSMFFNPEDVNWFKPVELVTKHGARGRIKESLGTHGLFKALFNKTVPQHDTVCLPLWKRVYPKWGSISYAPLLDTEVDVDCTAPLPADVRLSLMAASASVPARGGEGPDDEDVEL